MIVFYVAGMDANFHTIKDVLYAAAEESIRTHEVQLVMVDDGGESGPYIYCRVSKGNQA